MHQNNGWDATMGYHSAGHNRFPNTGRSIQNAVFFSHHCDYGCFLFQSQLSLELEGNILPVNSLIVNDNFRSSRIQDIFAFRDGSARKE